MRNEYDHIDKFVKKIDKEFVYNIFIYDTNDGYILFDRYKMQKFDDFVQVERFSDGKIIDFSSSKNATTWCILDRYNKIIESRRVLDLDRFITSLRVEMAQHKRLQKVGTLETKEINRDKYLQDLDKQKRFQWEIDKYIKMAKICQNKGYQNELTRTSGK